MSKGEAPSIGCIIFLILFAVLMRFYWRAVLWTCAIAALVLTVFLVAVRYFTAGGQAQSLADKGRFEEALKKMAAINNPHHLMQFLRHKIPFPDSKIRTEVAGAAKELLTLRTLASDSGYPRLPESLRASLGEETGRSLDSLWRVCQHLADMSRSKQSAEELEQNLQPVRDKIHRLVEAVNETRTEISRLTLGKLDALEEDVTGPIDRVKWQIREMRRVEEMLGGNPPPEPESEGPSPA